MAESPGFGLRDRTGVEPQRRQQIGSVGRHAENIPQEACIEDRCAEHVGQTFHAQQGRLDRVQFNIRKADTAKRCVIDAGSVYQGPMT